MDEGKSFANPPCISMPKVTGNTGTVTETLKAKEPVNQSDMPTTVGTDILCHLKACREIGF